MIKEATTYLGDGLYAVFDGYQFKLWTRRGNLIHEIYLDLLVYRDFKEFAESFLKEEAGNQCKLAEDSR